MPKNFIKRILPSHEKVKNHKGLKIFGKILHEPNLWHLNRRSASGAFAIGLFFAFCPLPIQMWLAAGCAIIFRVNLPISVATVWLTNPITMPPVFYACYVVGATVLGVELGSFKFELSWDWIITSLETIGPAFLVGCLICSVVSSILGYYILNWLWRRSVKKAWRDRQLERATSHTK